MDLRIGNDFDVVWSIYRDGEPFDLSEVSLTLYLKNIYGKKTITDFSVEDNKVKWTFFGKDQKQTGKYTLILVGNEDEEGMFTTDAEDFVRLVSRSSQVDNEQESLDIQIETIELSSYLQYGNVVVDPELDEQSTNAVQNAAVTKAIIELGERIAPSDWNAPEGDAGHILNRTHYKEESERSFVAIEKGDYILDDNGQPDGWESWVEAGGVEDESAKVSLPVTIAFGLSHLNFELTFDHVGQREILEYQEYENSYASILEVGIDEKEGECYLHFTTRGCASPWLIDGQEIDVRIESFKQLDDEYIPSTIVRESDLEGLYAEIDSQNQLIEDLQNTKIDKEADDYYPQLSVGLADNLAGVDVVASEVSFRRSGGGAISDGTARIEAIKGNSLVWNQGIYNSNFAEGLLKWEASNTSLTINADGSIRATNDTGDSQGIFQYVTMPCAANHKVLVIVDFQRSDLLQTGVIVYLRKQQGGYDIGSAQISSVNRERVGLIIQTTDIILGVRIYPFSYGPVGSYCDIYGCYMYDLTKMFGAGKEPTTIEEFDARKPLGIDENVYTDGDVIHMDVQSLESVGVNQWDGVAFDGYVDDYTGGFSYSTTSQRTGFIKVLPNTKYNIHSEQPGGMWGAWYDKDKNFIKGLSNYRILHTAPNNAAYVALTIQFNGNGNPNTFCVNISDTSINGKYYPYIKRTEDLSIIRKYFPEGMKSAGTAHDEIRYNKATQKWEKVQRIAEVDLGSLKWNAVNEADGRFRYNVQLPSMKTFVSTEIANVLVSLLPTVTGWNVFDNAKEGVAVMNPNFLSIHAKRYEGLTSSEFKAAMQGVILYYELAEPIVTEIEGDFNLDYEVWNGGTEEVISDVQTTPLKAEIAYGFNVVGKIKEHSQQLTELSAEIGNKQDTLESGVNIKTINGNSLLGEGNIEIEASEGTLTAEEVSSTEPTAAFPQVLYTAQSLSEEQKSQARENIGVSEAIEEAIAEIPAPESSVFEAIYGETTYDELVAAVNAKRHVICFFNGKVYNMCNYQENMDIFFSCVTSAVYTIQCLVSGKWSASLYSYERNDLKVTSLSDKSTNGQYPSAKAVYDFVQNSITNVLNEEV